VKNVVDVVSGAEGSLGRIFDGNFTPELVVVLPTGLGGVGFSTVGVEGEKDTLEDDAAVSVVRLL
jgi:hypothetical protein